MNYEELKKLLPREKDKWDFLENPKFKASMKAQQGAEFMSQGANEMLDEVTASLSLLVEYIYEDLREQIENVMEIKDRRFATNYEAEVMKGGYILAKSDILSILTPKDK
jgi:hypothetical protein